MQAKNQMHKYWTEQEVFEAGFRTLSDKKQAPDKKLLNYLVEFQHDQLTTGTVSRPPSFAAQRKRLVAEMQKNYPEQGYRQLVIGQAIDIPNLLELLLVMHHVTHDIELTDNFGYAPCEVAAGVYTARNIPHAEFSIIDNELQQLVAASSEVKPSNKQHVSIVMTERNSLVAQFDNGEQYMVKDVLRTDLAPYSLMNYLLAHPNTIVTRSMANTQIAGCEDARNLGEIVRQCGFNGPLKELFFPISSATKLQFRKDIYVSSEQIVLFSK